MQLKSRTKKIIAKISSMQLSLLNKNETLNTCNADKKNTNANNSNNRDYL